MSKWLRLFIILMAIVYVQIPSSALANTITDNLVPQDGRENVGNVELEYNRYPTSHYHIYPDLSSS